MAKQSLEHHSTERAVAFMLGNSGVVPIYAEAGGNRREMFGEQVELGKMIVRIVEAAKRQGVGGRRRGREGCF